jgi:CDP-diglyceride synthetase
LVEALLLGLTGIFFIIILGICIFVSYEIYLAATNTSSFDQNWKYYLITIVVPLVVLFSYILYGYTLEKQEMVLLYVTFGLVIVLLGILYILVYTGLSRLLFNQYILYTLSFGIIVIGLAIVYNVFTEKFKKQTGWSGFLVNILFLPV